MPGAARSRGFLFVVVRFPPGRGAIPPRFVLSLCVLIGRAVRETVVCAPLMAVWEEYGNPFLFLFSLCCVLARPAGFSRAVRAGGGMSELRDYSYIVPIALLLLLKYKLTELAFAMSTR